MNAEGIARELGLKRKGHTWRGQCPLHGGTSFTVSEKDGKPVFYCWSGCDRAAILAELKRRGLWPESNLTPAEKREWAAKRRLDEAAMQAAGYFGMAAAAMFEEVLAELSGTDPAREFYTAAMRTLGSEAGVLSEYRSWRKREPAFAEALVAAGRIRQARLEILVRNFLSRTETDRAA